MRKHAYLLLRVRASFVTFCYRLDSNGSMTPVTDLLEQTASELGLAERVVARYWRELREAGLVPPGKRGIGGRPAYVGTRELVTLITAILLSDSPKEAATLVPTTTSWTGRGPLTRMYARFDDGETQRISFCTLAPPGAPFPQALGNVIDAMRCSDPAVAQDGRAFGPVTFVSSAEHRWAEIAARVMQPNRITQRAGVGPAEIQPIRIFFDAATGQLTGMIYSQPYPAEQVPPWAKPRGLSRFTTVQVPILNSLAHALGRLAPEELSWPPQFETKTFTKDPSKEEAQPT
jgi:hypothetical protein